MQKYNQNWTESLASPHPDISDLQPLMLTYADQQLHNSDTLTNT
jgi:hypothetical protein